MRQDPASFNPLIDFLLRVEGLGRKTVWRLAEGVGGWEAFQALRAEDLPRDWPYLPEGPRQALAAALPARARFVPSPRFLSYRDPRYPDRLFHLSDPPCGLYFRGNEEVLSKARPWVALVGTRRASSYALEVCARLVGQMKEFDPIIVSGLALGVDGAAHRAALAHGLKTVAVLGSSVEAIYPAGHRELARRILREKGLLLSESPPDSRLEAWHFPKRNRLIAALCDAVVVVEAPERSGALLTADFALDLGREIYAVPGSIEDGRNRGGHRLIREGARLISEGREIFIDLGLASPLPKPRSPVSDSGGRIESAPPLALSEHEHKLLEIIAFESCHIDKIADISHLPSPQVAGLLVQLGLKGLVAELPGQRFQLKALGREWLSNPES